MMVYVRMQLKKEQKFKKARCLQPVPVEGDSKINSPSTFSKSPWEGRLMGCMQKKYPDTIHGKKMWWDCGK